MTITGKRAATIVADEMVPPRTPALKIAAYDADGIWGVGDNADQALAEAAGEIRDHFADPDDAAAERTIAGLKTAPVDDVLVADLHLYGAGFEYFAIVDGVLVPADAPFALGVIADADALPALDEVRG